MKTKIKVVLFFLSLGVITRAQNLVSNGYFETYNTTSAPYFPIGWYMYATPDFYATSFNHVPYNNAGYQKDCCGGNAYVGEYMIGSCSNSGDSCREYIETKLIDTLKAGHKYLASMYVNRSNNFDYSISTVGMLFTDTFIPLPPYPQFYIVNASPQVKSTTLLSDTMNWILIQDTVTAVGNEVYLTIGNFNTTATSDTVTSSGTWTYYGAAYYYIDGVSVYDLATMGIEQVKNKEAEVNLYPNPSDGNMAVEYKITNDAELQIIDLNGNLVEAYNLPATGNRIEVKNQNLQNGVYLYRISSNNAVIKFGKVVIMK